VADGTAPASVLGVFRTLSSKDFRLLWLSQTASVVGDGLILVAVGLFVTRLTGDPSDVGLVLTAYSAPLVVFLLIGGVVADRLPRQLVMMTSDVFRGLLHASLAVLIATGVVAVWHMVVVGLLFGSAEAFFRPAYTGLVPQTVPEDQIQSAQALGGLSREVATFVSPALATALVLSVGGAAAFGLDALTFAVSAALLSRVHARPRGQLVAPAGMVRELAEGWKAVRSRGWVWATIASFSLSLLVALAPFFVLGAAVAQQVYGSSSVYGLANAAWGVGTMSGALLGARWRPRRPMRAAVLAAAPWPGCISVFALGPPRAVLYGAMAMSGLGIGLFAVWWETALAQRIPPHLLSRVSAWDWMGSLALLPLGYLLAGPVGSVVGESRLMVVGGAIGVAATALALLPRSTRTLARLDDASVLPVPPAGRPSEPAPEPALTVRRSAG
jgi:MFS family permease